MADVTSAGRCLAKSYGCVGRDAEVFSPPSVVTSDDDFFRRNRTPSSGAFVSCRIHRLAIFIEPTDGRCPPPLLQTCLLQSSSLLPHVYRRGIALLRHDAVFVLFFPPAALRMVSCGCFFPCRCLFFSDFAAAPQYASPCPKLAQAFSILGVYTIHFLQLLARTAYARSCKRMITFDGLLLSSRPGMCM